MFRKFSLVVLVFAILTGCAKKSEDNASADLSSVESSQRETTKHLAYEYSLFVEVAHNLLKQQYDSSIKACSTDRINDCTILESSLSTNEHFSSASIRLRIKPVGVDAITRVASNNGKVVRHEMKVEDLAKEIIDSEQRTKMLNMQRDRLLELEKKATDDLASLIKISSEIASIQSQLEYSAGKDAYLLQRTNMDIVNIDFSATQDAGFWLPIGRSASNFSVGLSNGLAEVISASASILPFFLLFLVLLFVTRSLWRKFK